MTSMNFVGIVRIAQHLYILPSLCLSFFNLWWDAAMARLSHNCHSTPEGPQWVVFDETVVGYWLSLWQPRVAQSVWGVTARTSAERDLYGTVQGVYTFFPLDHRHLWVSLGFELVHSALHLWLAYLVLLLFQMLSQSGAWCSCVAVLPQAVLIGGSS